MSLIPYTSTITIDLSSAGQKFALVHPGGSKIGSILFGGLDILSARFGALRFQLHRHPSTISGGSLGTIHSSADNVPASFAELRFNGASVPVDAPTFDTFAFAHTYGTAPGTVIPTHHVAHGALMIGPGHSLVFETLDPDTRGNVAVRLFWGEQLSSITLISAVELNAYPAYLSSAYFDISFGWKIVTFFVTYTAHISSSGGNVAYRAVATPDETNAFPLHVVNETLDISAPPAARRIVYQSEERWPSLVTMGETTRFMISYNIPGGVHKIRFEIAEIGDLVNRGTVTVEYTGG